MIPTEEEKQRIQDAQLVNPDVPLGSAEQFLLTLSSITELSARLQLWAFKMDYEVTEKVRAPPPFCHPCTNSYKWSHALPHTSYVYIIIIVGLCNTRENCENGFEYGLACRSSHTKVS